MAATAGMAEVVRRLVDIAHMTAHRCEELDLVAHGTRQTDRQTGTDRQAADRQTDKAGKADRQTDRQADRQAGRWKELHPFRCLAVWLVKFGRTAAGVWSVPRLILLC